MAQLLHDTKVASGKKETHKGLFLMADTFLVSLHYELLFLHNVSFETGVAVSVGTFLLGN